MCCGCSGKEIYLPTAKIAPSFRNFLTPCVPVANRRVVGVVVPRTTPRVLFTKLGKLCVFDTVRTRRRAESCRFCRKIPFFFSLFFAERMLQPSRSRYRCFACMAFAFFLHPYRVTARSEQGGSPGRGSCTTECRSTGSKQTRSRRSRPKNHPV